MNIFDWVMTSVGTACWVGAYFVNRWRKRRLRSIANDARPTWRSMTISEQTEFLMMLEVRISSRWPFTWMPEKHREKESKKVSAEFVDYLDNT